MPEAVIVAAARSPIGRARKGSLADVRPDDMAAQMVRAALAQIPALDAGTVDDLQLGCAIPEGHQGGNLARIVASRVGLDTVPGATVSRFCASSIETTRSAFHAIRAGEATAIISAGVESLSMGTAKLIEEDARDPYFQPAWERSARRASREIPAPWHDPRDDGEEPDPYILMGQTAENVAELRGISREAQDAYALESQRRAQAAIDSGFFARETTPLSLPDGTVITADDSPRPGTTLEKLAALEPVFREHGTVTAGNCCPLSDAAAALVIMEADRARELGLTPLARIVATGVSALSPEIMGLGPVDATRRALALAGMSIGDIDYAELNEAFAAQVIPVMEDLGIDHDRLNVNGGAIALGHAWGATGARLITTLIHTLRERDAERGLATLCVGGGQGMALILERTA